MAEDLAERLEAALKNAEASDESFKTSREDELHQQRSKAWVARCAEVTGDLRKLGRSIVDSHQVLLDMGQEGAGVGATAWIEEASLKFGRLSVRLKGSRVIAEFDQKTVLTAPSMEAVTYDWLEQAIVEWLVIAANR